VGAADGGVEMVGAVVVGAIDDGDGLTVGRIGHGSIYITPYLSSGLQGRVS